MHAWGTLKMEAQLIALFTGGSETSKWQVATAMESGEGEIGEFRRHFIIRSI